MECQLLKSKKPRVVDWVARFNPCVLCLQETKMASDAFPHSAFEEMGYESVHNGQGRWNGVAILSNVGLDNVCYGFDDGKPEDPDARIILSLIHI